MDAEIDEIPVAQLADRYNIHRSQVYTRLDALKRRDSEMVPYRRGRKAYINRYMLQCLDGMAALLQQGQTTEQAADQVLGTFQSSPDSRADCLVDTRHIEESGLAIKPQNGAVEQELGFKDLLDILRGIQEVADNSWWLGTSELARALRLKQLPAGESFERYGFRFIRAGKNGAETAWKVEKLN